MLFLLPTALLSFASQPGGEGPSSPPPPGPPPPNGCSVIQDTCDGCTETGPGDSFISFLNLEQFHSKWATIQNTRTRDRTAPRPPAAYLFICLGRGLLCVRSQNSDSNPNLRRYVNGDFDIIVDVRSAEDYAIRHVTGAYNHPGLAFLPSTDDLIPNLGDCKAVAVAVPCALLIVNYHPDPQRPPHTRTSASHAHLYADRSTV